MNSVPEPRQAGCAAIWMPVGRDAALTAGALERAGIRTKICLNSRETCDEIVGPDAGLLIIAEEALTPATTPPLHEALEKQPAWSDIPILLLTARTSSDRPLDALRKLNALGKAMLLDRPLRTITLVAAVETALRARARQCQIRDYITELQEAHKRLELANADLRQFAFAASHDLQEPLRMVNAFTQLLLERHLNPRDRDAQEYADYVRKGVKRMEALLHDLLSYSKVVHTEPWDESEDFDLSLALTDALTTLKVQIDGTGAIIRYGGLPKVHGDRTQLSLVFQNLVGNSMKYAKQGTPPQIEITTEHTSNENLIRVRDNGIGFDERYAERIFELFQRLNGSETSGTGLGLAISRRIIERHGGRIWAESTPGEGSTFTFTLPAYAAPAPGRELEQDLVA